MFKWYLLLSTKYDAGIVVEGFNTKEEALEKLIKYLKEEPDNITFYTIRKEG